MAQSQITDLVASRALALILDNIIVLAISFAVSLPIGLVWGLLSQEAISTTLFAASFGLVFLLPVIPLVIGPIYFTYYEGSKGRTIGKKRVDLEVLKNADSSEIGYLRAFGRHLIDPIVASLLWIPSVIVIYITGGRRIGDLLAGTKVVKVSE